MKRFNLSAWAVSHPAREVARSALLDGDWQSDQRRQLQQGGARLAQLLRDAGFDAVQGTALFCTAFTARASEFQQQLAQQGILTRCFSEPSALRFGLPPDNAGWRRLEHAIATLHHAPENAR